MLIRLFNSLITLWFCTLPLLADYTTPGSGVHYSLDSLVVYSLGAVTGSNGLYLVNASVTVSNNDTLSLSPGDTLVFTGSNGTLFLEIHGALFVPGTEQDSIIITSQNKIYGDYEGINYRNTNTQSAFHLRFCRVEYAERAIDVVGGDALVEHCRIQHNSEAALDLSSSNSVIRNSVIHHNRRWALTMSLSSSPLVENNLFTENNFENTSPYVIITIGLQGVNSPVIRGNTIIGGYEQSGAISVWGNSNALIENNHIENCAYGILCFQNGANPHIRGNFLLNNNINPGTDWGFGIACNGPNAPIITGNEIEGHFYGVAIINGAQPNVGNLSNADTTDDGKNRFLGNGIGSELYELFNNNPLPIFAENNWWGTNDPDSIEARIVHSADSSIYGTVDFIPFIVMNPVGIPQPPENIPQTLTVYPAYPNPFNPATNVGFGIADRGFTEVKIYDILGREVKTLLKRKLPAGDYQLSWDGTDNDGKPVKSGLFIYRIQSGMEQRSGKVVLVR
jgi:hypothetical protein